MAHALSPGDNLVHSHVADDGDTAVEGEEYLRLMPQNSFEHRNLLQGYRGIDAPIFRAQRESLFQGEAAQGVKSNISICVCVCSYHRCLNASKLF